MLAVFFRRRMLWNICCLNQASQSNSHPVTVMYPRRWLPNVSIHCVSRTLCISSEFAENIEHYAILLLLYYYIALFYDP